MKISDKEIEAVSKLEPLERYQYFMKKVADTEKMYSLVDKEGNFALSDVEINVLFSLWPAPEFALKCAQGAWEGFTVKEITIEDFEDNILDIVSDNNWLINVFSIECKTGFVVDFGEFARDLSHELKKYH
jgi:hypothetical protein